MNPGEFDHLLAAACAEGIHRFVVAAVIIRDHRALLLQRRPDDFLGGMYEIPGGAVEPGESLPQALEREVDEETGLTLTRVDEYRGCFDYSSRDGRTTRQFSFRVTAGDTPIVLSEHQAFAWVSRSELDLYYVSDETRALLTRALS